MGRIEDLADKYERHVSAPWQRNLARCAKGRIFSRLRQDRCVGRPVLRRHYNGGPLAGTQSPDGSFIERYAED